MATRQKKNRSTVYNKIVFDGDWEQVSETNKKLVRGYLRYCKTNDRSPQTISQYQNKLSIFFVWNYKENDNKPFTQLKKRELVEFLGWGRAELGWSPNYLAMMKSVLSSFSNYIERILDDDYPNFKNLVTALEPIHIEKVREKTILTPEQIDEALKQLTEQGEHQMACYLSLLFCSGMRKSEALQMKVSYFVPENIVFDVFYRTPKIRTKGRGMKGKQIPRYIFAYEFQPYLDRWLEQRKEWNVEMDELFIRKTRDGYVPATVSTLNTWADKLSLKMNVDMYAHASRHAWTTRLSKEGYPKDIIQKVQGWANANMVDLYNDTTEEESIEDFFKNKTE